MSLGKINNIEEMFDLELGNTTPSSGTNGANIGFSQMLSALRGYGEYDGYKIETDLDTYLILIDNGQSCCESWGYFTSEDDTSEYIGKELIEVRLTDKALNNKKVKDSGYYEDCGGIQFVDFVMSDGSVLQFAVYNAHNGYYGHGIIVAKGSEILLSDTL